MAYGIEVKNASGRTVFNSDETYPNYYSVSGPVTANGYSPNPSYSAGSSSILLARPHSNASGAVFYDPVSGVFGATSFGVTDSMRSFFGMANGIRYAKFDSQAAIARATSGYGIEVFESTGSSILYSSNITYGFNILAVGSLVGVSEVTYTPPAGVAFNTVFVSAMSFTGVFSYAPGTPPFSPDFWTFFGSLAHFNNSTGVITIKQTNIVQGVTTPTWQTASNFYAGTNARRDYMIVEVLS
jgi:hypothetical protein